MVMAGDIAMMVKIVIGGAIAVAVVSIFPPLTSYEPPKPTKTSRTMPPSALQDNGLSFCRETMQGVDCGCFAQKAGEVLGSARERAAGWTYVDQWDLARAQATESCS